MAKTMEKMTSTRTKKKSRTFEDYFMEKDVVKQLKNLALDDRTEGKIICESCLKMNNCMECEHCSMWECKTCAGHNDREEQNKNGIRNRGDALEL